ncbi:t-like holin protein [Salmonella phage Melville]|uniref:Holin n=1 Tax=Salmonella phage Melville TaxID=2041413 RepID=A0A2D1GMF4_9CAUD|nr:holin [Salmonella phage Melville]ATN93219.1 t-like holin protein [Salmonella phage Melville]
MASKISLPITDIIFGVWDRVFKDNASGRVLVSRVVVVIIFFVLGLVWSKSDAILTTYRDSSYDAYAKIIQQERESRFETTALEQLQIVHISSGADFTAVYSFRPKNLNYFVDLIAYEGRLPATVSEKSLDGFPVDKTTNEYSTHLGGRVFKSSQEFAFLPSKKKATELKYMFSCPYFNLDNIYAGTVSMYWYDGAPSVSPERLESICGQAARTLGRSR